MSEALMKQAEQDLRELQKLSEATSTMTAATKYYKALAGPLVMALAGAGAVGGINWYTSKKDQERMEDALRTSSAKTLLKDSHFEKNPDTYTTRFNELATISPTIAMNPSLAHKVIKSKFSSGFSIDDIHRLSSIERNTRSTGYGSPSTIGVASAQNAFGTLVSTFGRDYLQHYGNTNRVYQSEKGEPGVVPGPRGGGAPPPPPMPSGMRDSIHAAYKQHKKDHGGDGEKMASANDMKLSVSEECLGQMLSDRYVMLKTAAPGFMGSLQKGTKDLFTIALPYMASSVALAGGVELVKNVLESRRNSALETQADHTFNGLMRTSDVIKANPNEAREAFSTLKAFAPSLAARPMVMRTFVENVVNAGQIPPDMVASLAEAENKVRGIGGGGEGMLAGLKNTTKMFGLKPAFPKARGEGRTRGESKGPSKSGIKRF